MDEPGDQVELSIDLDSVPKKFPCDECEEVFDWPSHLRKHFWKFHAKKIFECDICNFKFKIKYLLDVHKKNHGEIKEHQCDICFKNFALSRYLKDHLRRTHGKFSEKNENEVRIDKQTFSSGKSIRQEKGCKPRPKPSLSVVEAGGTCKFCGMAYTDYQKHSKEHHQSGFKCTGTDCNKVFKTVENLAKHQVIHEEKKIECTICQQILTNVRSIKDHYKKMHQYEKIYFCGLCDIIYLTYEEYQLHDVSSHKHPEFRQASYTDNFSNKLVENPTEVIDFNIKVEPEEISAVEIENYQKQNNEMNHIISDREIYLKQEEDQFWDENEDTNETATSENEQNVSEDSDGDMNEVENGYSCDVCGRRFESKKFLNSHMLAHGSDSDRKFACKQCGMKFKTKSAIYDHVQTHQDQKIYNCQYCYAKFNVSRYLNDHLRRRHEDERPFPCNFCDERFKTASEMKRHKRTSGHGQITKAATSEIPKPKEAKPIDFEILSPPKKHMRKIFVKLPGEPDTEEGVYRCHICGGEFPCRRYLVDHLRKSHHKENPFECPKCDFRAPSMSILKDHFGKKHNCEVN